MAEYTVQGERQDRVESVLPLEGAKPEVKGAVRMDVSTRAGGPTAVLEIDDDDLLEVEFDNGFVLWTTIERLQHDAKRGGTRSTDHNLLPTRYPAYGSSSERGLVSNMLRSLKIINLDLPRHAALTIADKIERGLQGDGQFFRISAGGELFREDPETVGDPSLVLIHGTASATKNAFAGYLDENAANRDIWKAIYQHYQGRVFGFEHRTLTKSPLENAIEFLQALPSRAHLHLVSHSRGGLVGDLIAHGGLSGEVFAQEDLRRELSRAYDKDPDTYTSQKTLYEQFNAEIASRAPQVTRYVRVGCPAAGTTFASRRLDVYLSILINLMGKIPGVGPFLGGLGEFVAAVAKERTQPEVLPGLEAQMPTSAFVRLLNGSPHELQSELTVLAGDSDGLLKNLANLFFWRANDLVVETRSMYSGAPRAQRLWYLEENRDVTHLNYFRRAETARIVQRGLTHADGDTNGFETRRPKGVARGEVDAGEPGDNSDRPGVILLPGMMGSHLSMMRGQRRERIWLDATDLLRGKGGHLDMGQETIKADGVLNRPYDDFRDYLVRQGLHVMPMPYDWRLSLVTAAEALDALVKERLDKSAKPLYLIAHSMGGMVASLFIARYPDRWKALRSRGGRLVQAGTPNRGSYVIPRILQGEEKMIRWLAALDLSANLSEWAKRVARFPGILELAPTFDSLDFSKKQTWDDLDVLATPLVRPLRAAMAVAQEVADHARELHAQDVRYVAGGPNPTPVYDAAEQRICWTMRGDGRVTWDSGIPDEVPTWYLPVKHGSLLDFKPAFPGLTELLLTGTTRQLATERPPASASLLRGEIDEPPMLADDQEVNFLPSQDDLEEAALGMDELYGGSMSPVQPVPPCLVSVVHGDLRFVTNPVLVGHYKGDPIVHAEAVLDQCLNGALGVRHQLHRYPGNIGTAEVFLGRPPNHLGHQGAIVVGLGNVGELTVGGLIRTLEEGLLEYAQACFNLGKDTASLKVSTLLVGSNEAGLTIPQIVDATLTSVSQANRVLEKLRTGDGVGNQESPRAPLAFYSQIEIVELYHDIALEALHSVCAMASGQSFEIRRSLVVRDGGRRRARATQPRDWWSRLAIGSRTQQRHDYAQTLTFTAYGDRARVTITDVQLQKPLVDRLLQESIRDQSGRGGIQKALFELLVPLELKAAAADRHHLQLVLDDESAAYPWELLVDRRFSQNHPVGIGSGLIRQLRIDDAPVVSHPEENQILVVGDPPSHWADLPGARQEAIQVASTFTERGWLVLEQITGKTPQLNASSIIETLLTNDFRILHLAGHGNYDPACPVRSGMVLGGGSDDKDDPLILLTPAEVSQMRLQPELVFINCCHLGRIERTHPPAYHKLAANLATQFIRYGVKAVVAAGWPVEDDAAVTFSQTFYRAMLKGADFGTAVRSARQLTFERYPHTNTWGAYQCYGDPGFRLLMDMEIRSQITQQYRDIDWILDVSELLVELDNLVHRAKVDNAYKDKKGIADRCHELETMAARKGWLSTTGVLVGLGRVYGELGDFERAIDLLAKGAKQESGGVTLTDLEQLANFRARLGKNQSRPDLIYKAISDLEYLVQKHGQTAERLCLIAASYKRLVEVRAAHHQDEARQALLDMTEYYIRAADLRARNWDYPASNALLGVLLLGGPWDKPPEPMLSSTFWEKKESWTQPDGFKEKLNDIEAFIRGRIDQKDFWDAIALVDLTVIRHVWDKDNVHASAADEIVGKYKAVQSTYGSERQIDSMIGQLSFATEIAKQLDLTDIYAALTTLKGSLSN